MIACEVDRVLQDKGQLVVLDFCPLFPFKNKYHHRDGLSTFKLDYSNMFLWNPNFYIMYHKLSTHHGMALISDPNERLGITVLGKDEDAAYPLAPFSR